MIKKAVIGIGAAVGAIVMALLTQWAMHLAGPGGKLEGCINAKQDPVWRCVRDAMCAHQDFPRFTCR
jgi:hypothetical protein